MQQAPRDLDVPALTNETDNAGDVTPQAPGSTVCSSCLAAAEEEGAPDRQSQELVMVEMGADIADHLCDAREAPDLKLSCACACSTG